MAKMPDRDSRQPYGEPLIPVPYQAALLGIAFGGLALFSNRCNKQEQKQAAQLSARTEQKDFTIRRWYETTFILDKAPSSQLTTADAIRKGIIYMETDRECLDVSIEYIPEVGIIAHTTNGADCNPETEPS